MYAWALLRDAVWARCFQYWPPCYLLLETLYDRPNLSLAAKGGGLMILMIPSPAHCTLLQLLLMIPSFKITIARKRNIGERAAVDRSRRTTATRMAKAMYGTSGQVIIAVANRSTVVDVPLIAPATLRSSPVHSRLQKGSGLQAPSTQVSLNPQDLWQNVPNSPFCQHRYCLVSS